MNEYLMKRSAVRYTAFYLASKNGHYNIIRLFTQMRNQSKKKQIILRQIPQMFTNINTDKRKKPFIDYGKL